MTETWSITLTLPVSPKTPDAPPDWARFSELTFSVAATVSPPAPVRTAAPSPTRATVRLSIDCVRNEPPTPTAPAWLPITETGLPLALRLAFTPSGSSWILIAPARLSSSIAESAVTLTDWPSACRVWLTLAPEAMTASTTVRYAPVPYEPVDETSEGTFSAVLEAFAQTLNISLSPPLPPRAAPSSATQLPSFGSPTLKRWELNGRNRDRLGKVTAAWTATAAAASMAAPVSTVARAVLSNDPSAVATPTATSCPATFGVITVPLEMTRE